MKYLDNKPVMMGDAVIAATDSGKSLEVGRVHEIYERGEQVRITGYALRVDAADCVLAKEAYDAYAAPFLKARSEAEAIAKAAAKKTALAESEALTKAGADAPAKLKAELEAKALEEATARARLEAKAKAIVEAELAAQPPAPAGIPNTANNG